MATPTAQQAGTVNSAGVPLYDAYNSVGGSAGNYLSTEPMPTIGTPTLPTVQSPNLTNYATNPNLSYSQYQPGGSATSTGTGTPSLGSSLGNLGGLLGSGSLGNLALYGGLYELLASQASSAQEENANLAGQITQVGAPSVAAGQQQLGAYSAGQLTNPFQTQLTAALTANQQQATSQQAQAATALAGSGGGQNISGALLGQTQQIQAQQSQLDTQAVSNAFASELAASDSLISTGGPYVQAGVTQEISSNTALQQQLSQLMGALASAYAQSTSGGSGSSQQKPTTSTGAGSGAGSGGAGAGGGTGAFNQANYTPAPPGPIDPNATYTPLSEGDINSGDALQNTPLNPDYFTLPDSSFDTPFSGYY